MLHCKCGPEKRSAPYKTTGFLQANVGAGRSFFTNDGVFAHRFGPDPYIAAAGRRCAAHKPTDKTTGFLQTKAVAGLPSFTKDSAFMHRDGPAPASRPPARGAPPIQKTDIFSHFMAPAGSLGATPCHHNPGTDKPMRAHFALPAAFKNQCARVHRRASAFGPPRGTCRTEEPSAYLNPPPKCGCNRTLPFHSHARNLSRLPPTVTRSRGNDRQRAQPGPA